MSDPEITLPPAKRPLWRRALILCADYPLVVAVGGGILMGLILPPLVRWWFGH